MNALIDRIKAGDKAAFAELVGRYQKPLFGFLGRMGLNQSVAEEIAQEAFIRAWVGMARYDPAVSGFSTWLFTIARNLALTEMGRVDRRHESAEELPEVPCERAGPLQELVQARMKASLQAALRALQLADRSVLALAYIRDLSLSDIAAIEGCSQGAVKTRLHRAKQKLQKLMEEEK